MKIPECLDRIVLVRHCSTKLNEDGKLISASDPCLSEQGLEQLSELYKWMDDNELRLDTCISSDLKRCYQTANKISSNVIRTPLLRERSLGRFESLSSQELVALKKKLGLPIEDPSLIWEGVEETESDLDVFARFTNSLRDLQADKHTEIVVVTHAGVLKAVVYHLLGIPPTRPYSIKFGLGCAIVLGRQGDRFELRQLWENPLAKERHSA